MTNILHRTVETNGIRMHAGANAAMLAFLKSL